jgi:glycosyltransferase involved in cell wall biosynthesis
VCAAFCACDIFVLPSRYGENFGIAAIEAMAAGKPVVVSNRGGLPALVTSGENGLVVPAESPETLREALQKLFASEDLRQGLGRQGRKLVAASYTWQKVGEAYFSLFAEAQASRR